jgi:hypothetical protein
MALVFLHGSGLRITRAANETDGGDEVSMLTSIARMEDIQVSTPERKYINGPE